MRAADLLVRESDPGEEMAKVCVRLVIDTATGRGEEVRVYVHQGTESRLRPGAKVTGSSGKGIGSRREDGYATETCLPKPS